MVVVAVATSLQGRMSQLRKTLTVHRYYEYGKEWIARWGTTPLGTSDLFGFDGPIKGIDDPYKGESVVMGTYD